MPLITCQTIEKAEALLEIDDLGWSWDVEFTSELADSKSGWRPYKIGVGDVKVGGITLFGEAWKRLEWAPPKAIQISTSTKPSLFHHPCKLKLRAREIHLIYEIDSVGISIRWVKFDGDLCSLFYRPCNLKLCTSEIRTIYEIDDVSILILWVGLADVLCFESGWMDLLARPCITNFGILKGSLVCIVGQVALGWMGYLVSLVKSRRLKLTIKGILGVVKGYEPANLVLVPFLVMLWWSTNREAVERHEVRLLGGGLKGEDKS